MPSVTVNLDDYTIELLRNLTGHQVGWPSDAVKKALANYIKSCAREKVVQAHNERMQLLEYQDYLAKKQKE